MVARNQLDVTLRYVTRAVQYSACLVFVVFRLLTFRRYPEGSLTLFHSGPSGTYECTI